MRLPAMLSDLLERRRRVAQFEGVRLRLGRRGLAELPTVEAALGPCIKRPRPRLARGSQRGCGLRATLGRQDPRNDWQPFDSASLFAAPRRWLGALRQQALRRRTRAAFRTLPLPGHLLPASRVSGAWRL